MSAVPHGATPPGSQAGHRLRDRLAGPADLGTVVVVSIENRTEQLEAEIGKFHAVQGFASSVRRALGCDPDTPMTADDAEVIAFMIQPSQQVITTWLLTATGFSMFELTRSGDRLIVAVPVWRVRRVVESYVGGQLTVTVELDADRVVTEHLPTAENGAHMSFSYSTTYAMSADQGPAETALSKFVQLFRQLLIAGA